MILNLTQHSATPDQISADVVEPAEKSQIQRLLTFDELPTQELLEERAQALAAIAVKDGAKAAMIGGAPFFMAPLEAALKKNGVRPLFAFSVRCSQEQVMPDGTVKKVAIFVHQGFVG